MKTIREIKEELQAASGTEREKLLELYREDTRSGVVSLVKKYDREKELLEKEKQRIEDMKVYENTYSHVGFRIAVFRYDIGWQNFWCAPMTFSWR